MISHSDYQGYFRLYQDPTGHQYAILDDPNNRNLIHCHNREIGETITVDKTWTQTKLIDVVQSVPMKYIDSTYRALVPSLVH